MRAGRIGWAAALACGTGAAAQVPPPAPPAPAAPSRSFSTVWIVLPDAAAAGREVSVKGGELILKQTLVPMGLARLTSAAVDPEGKFELGAGTELFKLMSDVPIYCVAGRKEPKGVTKWLYGGASTQLCLTDVDADGRFEGEFIAGSPVSGLPTLSGKRPKQADPLTVPAGYEKADPRTGATRYWVGIEYQGKPLLYNRRNFAVSFGTEANDAGKDDKGSLTDWVYTGGTFPASQELLGAKWTALALDGDRLKVRIDQPMPGQPFGIFHSVQYRFY